MLFASNMLFQNDRLDVISLKKIFLKGSRMRTERVIKHGHKAFSGMRKAGQLAAKVLDMITAHITPGVYTNQPDKVCHDFILANGAEPAPSIIAAFQNQLVFH